MKLRLHPLPERVFAGHVIFAEGNFDVATRHLWAALEHGTSGYSMLLLFGRDHASTRNLVARVDHIDPVHARRELAALEACVRPIAADIKEMTYLESVGISARPIGSSPETVTMTRMAHDLCLAPFLARNRAISVLLQQAMTAPDGGLIGVWRTIPHEVRDAGIAPRRQGATIAIVNAWSEEADDQRGVGWVERCAEAFWRNGVVTEAGNLVNHVSDPTGTRARRFYGDDAYYSFRA